jgi:hypothetical protein
MLSLSLAQQAATSGVPSGPNYVLTLLAAGGLASVAVAVLSAVFSRPSTSRQPGSTSEPEVAPAAGAASPGAVAIGRDGAPPTPTMPAMPG